MELSGVGFIANSTTHNTEDSSLPMFEIEKVELQFSIASDFVAAQVANNVLILALQTGRIVGIDLDNATDIDGSSAAGVCFNLDCRN